MRNSFSCNFWKLSICVAVFLTFHITTVKSQAPCLASAGSLTANPIVGFDISATPVGVPIAPAGFEVLYVLTSGPSFTIEAVSTSPSFVVSDAGLFTIHTLVHDPTTLDLSTIQIGVTTGIEVNDLLIAGGGTICAALDLAGAAFVVPELPDPCSLSCKSVNISIGLTTNADGSSTCEAVIGPDDVLTGACSDPGVLYLIQISDEHGTLVFETPTPIPFDQNITIDPSGLIGEEIQVNVIAVVGSTVLNSCWNTARIEDKRPPEIDCTDTDIIATDRVIKCCDGSQIDVALMREVFTECSDFEVVVLEQNDRPADCLAQPNYTRIIDVLAYAIDEFGNQTDPCTITIRVERLFPELTMNPANAPSLCTSNDPTMTESDSTLLVCPVDLTVLGGNPIDCSELDDFVTIPLNTPFGEIQVPAPIPLTEGGAGVPQLIKDINPMCGPRNVTEEIVFLRLLSSGHPDALALLANCNVGVSVSDQFLGQTDCITKIRRTWTLNEWHCSGEFEMVCEQTIEIADLLGPVVLTEVPDFEVTTNGFDCNATVTLPNVEFTDNCGPVNRIDVIHPNGILRDFANANEVERRIRIPEGEHEIIYRAFDGCERFTDETITISVWDNTPPVPVCDDNLVVSLTFDGAAQVFATSFDDGSYDDCALQTTVVRKMNPDNCDCTLHPPVFEDFTDLGMFEGSRYYLSDKPVIRAKAIQLGIAYGGHLVSLDGNGVEPAVDGIAAEIDWINGRLGAFFGMNIPFYHSAIEILTSTNKPTIVDLDADPQLYIIELTNPCGFSNSVLFCCGDLADEETMVVVRAIDKWGNFNECMVSVELQDKSEPQIVCPPNLVLACEFSGVDTENLDAFFGTVINGGQLEAIDGFALTGSGTSASNSILFYPGEFPSGESTPDPNTIFFDNGFALDNCASNLIIEELDPMDMRDQCGRGDIVRKFIAYNPGQQESATEPCEQTLTFVATDVFNFDAINTEELVDSVICISETSTDFCIDFSSNTGSLFPTSVFGEPSFPGEDNCDLLGIQADDQIVFSGTPNSTRNCRGDESISEFCYKVLREFTIINWCNFNGMEVTDVFEDRVVLEPQVIYIKDDVDPFIVANDNFDHEDKEKFCSFDPSCGPATVIIQRRGNVRASSCSTLSELEWYYCLRDENGNIVLEGQQDGRNLLIEQELPIGSYTLEYALYDKCGNAINFVTIIEVEFCKAPTAFCLNGLAVSLNEHGNVVLWANDFAKDVNGVCGDGVALSFSATDIDLQNITLCCEDVGLSEIDIYFTTVDENGEIPIHDGEEVFRQSKCTATVSVQDNGMVCQGDNMFGCDGKDGEAVQNGQGAQISGSISRPDDVMVSDVEVRLEGSFSSVNTDDEGEYAFRNMPLGGEYVINPQKADDPISGVSTLDLVLIQKHILGVLPLESAYQQIAADVNSDESISALDVLNLRKVILGLSESFPNNNIWNFVNKEYRFFDESNPLSENYMSTYQISPLEDDMVVDFLAVKTGDVNYSANINGFINPELRSSKVLSLDVQENILDQNLVELEVRADNPILLDGYQFTMNFDNKKLIYKGLQLDRNSNVTTDNFGIHADKGAITVSWHESEARQIAAGQLLFTIEFTKSGGAVNFDKTRISSAITAAEAYYDNEIISIEQADVELAGENALVLYQNSPNPFHDKTRIDFDLPVSGKVSLRIHTYTGKVIIDQTGTYNSGKNSIELSKDELSSAGVLYYTLTFDDQSLTKQMIIIN